MYKILLREQPTWLLRFRLSPARLWRLLSALLLLGSFGAQAQLIGTKAIPGTAPTGYPTLAAAITDLNAQGVGAGGVTFNIAAGYTETAANLLITATGTAVNPIVIQKSGTGANPVITAAAGTSTTLDAIIKLQGTDYLTLDGLTLTDPAANTTVTSQMEWGVALLKANTTTVDGCQNVVVRNCAITLQKGTLSMGIYVANHTPAVTTTLAPTTAAGTNSNNRFYGNTISGVNNGIYLIGYAAPSPYTYYDQNNEVGSIVSGTTATGNTISDYGTTTTAYGIYTIYQNGVKVQGNTVTSVTAVTTAGPTSTLYGILVTTGGNADLLGNNVTVTTNGTTATVYGIQNGSGANGLNGAATTVNMANNSLTMTSTTATTATFYGVYNTAAVANLNIFGNTLNNWSRTATTSGFNYMLYVSTGAITTQNVYNNTLSNFTNAGTTSGVYCIYAFNNASAAAQFYGNTVQNISNDGNTLYGMYLSGGNTLDVYHNRVSGLTGNGTTAAVYGIYTSGNATNLTNNLVGGFSTPNTSSTLAQIGLYLAGGTTVNAQYNSVYLNGTSTGANFGTSGIYYISTATYLVTLRNNVVVNTSTAAGTGSTVALRATSGTAGTAPANLTGNTNNNLYHAGTPSATNLIFAEGTTTLTNPQQTLASYKSFLGNREASSVTENPPFASTTGTSANFLQVLTTTPTQIESGGTPISGITTDYAGNTRNAATPDLGAYEGTYQLLDFTGPQILNATLNNTASTANRTLVVTITDPSGVATGANAPRLYYRRGTTGAFVFVNATSVSGNQYTFTLNYALLPGGSVTSGDVIQYYVAAQDLVATPNMSTSPGGGTGTTPPGSTAPATPGSYSIVGQISGIYYVGTGTSPNPSRTFATLTAAANAYNINTLGGAVTFLLLDAAYGTGETFPIVFNANPDASATNTLTIRPNTGVTSAITGSASATALIQFNGADFITLDGSNGAGVPADTSRDLTLTSSNTGSSAVVWVGSLGDNAGATNITLKNLNLVGGSATSTTSFGVYASSGTVALSGFSTGGDNDNLLVQNNAISRTYEGVYARGTANGRLNGLQILGNSIGADLATPANTVTFRGIDVQGATSPLISRNTVFGMYTVASLSIAAIELGQNVTDAVVSRNTITGLRSSSTGGWSAYGIFLSTGTNLTNAEISNNVISDILTFSYTSSTTFNPFGIRIVGGTGHKIYYNSVNMFGAIPGATATSTNISAALIVTSTAVTGLDIRNNIFVNSITGGTSKAYTIYLTGTASLTTSNYNDYYVSGPNGVLAYVAGDKTTLADLRTATSQDANSISVDPIFVSNTNLLPASGQIANGGTSVSVTVDFNGAARPAAAPSMGAYQFTPQAIDVAPNSLVSPVNSATSACFGANTPVTVQIRNNGSSNLNLALTPITVTVVISGPGSSTQTLTQTINTGTLASAATQNVTLTTLANFTPLGAYSFSVTATVVGDANTSNDVLTPVPTLNVAAPVVGTLSPTTYAICVSGSTTLNLDGAANGSIQYQSSSSATGPFTNISGATAAAYTTPTLTQTTYYRAQVTCGTNVVTSNVSTVTVNNPVISSAPSPVSTCAGGTATLTATVPTGVSVRYFTTATGGTAVGTGNPYVTPTLTSNTTYYAEAFAGGQEFVGKPSTTGTDGTNTAGGLYFTTTSATTITNVTVYRMANAAAGTATIQLLSGSTTTGTPITQITVPVPANTTSAISPTVLTLNFVVPAAGQYTLYLSTASPSLIRDFSSTPQPVTAYPYVSPSGVVRITDSTLGLAYYYFFYNWQIGGECVGASRTAIQVNVTPGLVALLPAASATICGTTPYTLNGSIAGTATGATYTSTGSGTFAPNATTLNATYTASAADIAAGTVTIRLTPTGPAAPCTAVAQTVLQLVAPPTGTFSYPSTSFCAGTVGTVSPTLGAGAVAGTFTASGSGLRIDPMTGVINLATSSGGGTYTVTNTVGSGVCTGTTATATVTVNFAVPTPTLTSTTQSNGSVLLTAQFFGGVTYQFYQNGTAVGSPSTSNTLLLQNSAQSGNYTVAIISSAGCVSPRSTAVTASVVTGVATATLHGMTLQVYPNPTPDGHLTLALRGTKVKTTELRVLNALGQVVRTARLTAEVNTLDLTALATGVYVVQVHTPEGVLTQRIVRE